MDARGIAEAISLRTETASLPCKRPKEEISFCAKTATELGSPEQQEVEPKTHKSTHVLEPTVDSTSSAGQINSTMAKLLAPVHTQSQRFVT